MKENENWTLFLDRDGVINRKLQNDYVKTIDEFEILEGVFQGLKTCNKVFRRVIIVTNQRGISLGKMTHTDLDFIHSKMLKYFSSEEVKIDAVFYCDGLNSDSDCRKPNTGMGLLAKQKYPDIDFKKSIMVGDSYTDIQFGSNLKMITVLIKSDDFCDDQAPLITPNYIFNSLFEFSLSVKCIIDENS